MRADMVKCELCYGRGKIACENCEGNPACQECEGRGFHYCPLCDGDGWIEINPLDTHEDLTAVVAMYVKAAEHEMIDPNELRNPDVTLCGYCGCEYAFCTCEEVADGY